MIKLLNKVPEGAYVYVDGGYKGFALADFVSKVKEVRLFHVVKDDSALSMAALKMVGYFADERGLKISIATITEDTRGYTMDEKLFNTLSDFGKTIATAESIEDAILFHMENMANNMPMTIPYRTRGIIRPFLLNKNVDIIKYVHNEGIAFLDEDMGKQEKENAWIKEALNNNPNLYKNTYDKIVMMNLLT